MSDLIKILQEADTLSLAVEKSRQNFESAKAALEKSKSQLDDAQTNLNALLSESEAAGFSRSKLKKLVEERTQALLVSGLWFEGDAPPAKAPKAPRKKAEKPALDLEPEDETDEALEEAHF